MTYANNDAAKNCLTEKKLKNHRLDEKEIEVKRAMPRGNKDKNASLKTHKIFVGGLDTDVDEETSRIHVCQSSDSLYVRVVSFYTFVVLFLAVTGNSVTCAARI